MSNYTLIVLLLATLAAGALFSISESALFSLGTVRLRRMKLRRMITAPLVRSLLVRPRRLLVTIVIGNMLALAAATALAAALGVRLHPLYGPPVAAAVMAVVVFVFAETLPKTIGVAWP
ncbi:MAG: DUF21 domain-containing protein, partial [Candidatus Coatesbacteria bacterium]